MLQMCQRKRRFNRFPVARSLFLVLFLLFYTSFLEILAQSEARLHSLALRLLGDVANRRPLLADDGSNVLRGHQQPQRDVGVRRLGRHPRARGAATGPTRSVSGATAVIRPPLAPVQLSRVVRDVRHMQGVVLKLVSVQLLDGSEGRRGSETRITSKYQNFSCSRT